MKHRLRGCQDSCRDQKELRLKLRKDLIRQILQYKNVEPKLDSFGVGGIAVEEYFFKIYDLVPVCGLRLQGFCLFRGAKNL